MLNMPSRKSRFNNSWSLGPSNNEPISDSNVGRKLLEKMGWANGLGLGKDNQGMVENPLWKSRRDALCKTGFKSKDEIGAPEVLPHQNAFEDLLGELNTVTGPEKSKSEMPLQSSSKLKEQISKRRVRYTKMARAKDINNYSLKDLEGIIGKEVTKKNLDLLCNDTNSEGIKGIKETSDSNATQMYPSSSGQNVLYKSKISFQKAAYQFNASQEKEITLEENNMEICNADELSEQNSECSKPKKKKKMKHHSNPSGSDDDDVLDVASKINSVSTEHMYDGSKRLAAEQTIEVEYSEICFNQPKKKKKRTINPEDLAIINTDIPPEGTNINADSASLEQHLCNFKSVREIRQKGNTSFEDAGVSKKAVPQFHASLANRNEDSSDLNRTDNSKESNEHCNGCERPNEIIKNGNSNIPTVVTRDNNNYFLTGEERQKYKKLLAENPDIVAQISDAFVGSNLRYIKGYGNW